MKQFKAGNMLPSGSSGAGTSSQHSPKRENLDTEPVNMEQFKAGNILPSESGVSLIQDSLVVIAATRALHISEHSEFPRFPSQYSESVGRDALDIFDFLHYAFCFQKDNVSDQREQLILLLVTAEFYRVAALSEVTTPGTAVPYTEPRFVSMNPIEKVYNGILANYVRWCDFLKQRPQTELANTLQKKLCLVALYLLVWFEEVNVPVLQGRLCHTFHHVASKCLNLLNRSDVERSFLSIKLIKGAQDEELISLAPVYKRVEKIKYRLVLDVNGVLCNADGPLHHMELSWRPELRKFLHFCHEKFVVIYWSACQIPKLAYLVDQMSNLSGVPIDMKQCMSQAECVVSQYRDMEKPEKPIFLKPLTKVYEGFPGANVTNTLLIDDSPDKNALNHPDSAIHPLSFKGRTADEDGRTLLKLKCWLDGLLVSNQYVQEYVMRNRPADGSLSIHGDHQRLNALLQVPSDDGSGIWQL